MATIHTVTASVQKALNAFSQTSSNEEGYRELTRRLPPNELHAIERQLAQVTDEQVDRFVKALNGRPLNGYGWNSPVIRRDENYPFCALKAFQRREITAQQLTTVMFYWVNFSKERGIGTVVPLFLDGGAVNPDAEDLIRQTLVMRQPKVNMSGKVIDVETSSEATFLTENQLKEFFRRMREELPISEQCFFIRMFTGAAPRPIENIQNVGINIFYETDDGVMIASCGMMDTFAKVKYGESALTTNPCMGYSFVEDTRKSIEESKWNMPVPFPLTTFFEKVGRHEAPGFACCYNNFFKLLMVSGISPKYRSLMLKIADFAKRYPLDLAQNLVRTFTEMEFPIAQEEIFKSHMRMNHVFWQFIPTAFAQTKSRFVDTDDPKFDSHSLFLTSEDERKFIEELVRIIPIDPEYASGDDQDAEALDSESMFPIMFLERTIQIIRDGSLLARQLKDIEPELKAEKERELRAQHAFKLKVVESQLHDLIELREHNIFKVLNDAWMRRRTKTC